MRVKYYIVIALFVLIQGCQGGGGLLDPGTPEIAPEEMLERLKEYNLPGKIITTRDVSYTYEDQNISVSDSREGNSYGELTSADVDLTFEFLEYDGYLNYERTGMPGFEQEKRWHGLRYGMSIISTDEEIPRVLAIVAPQDSNDYNYWLEEDGGYKSPFNRELKNRDGFTSIDGLPGLQPYIAIGEVPVSTAEPEYIEFNLKLPSTDYNIQEWEIIIFQMDELWDGLDVTSFELFDSNSSNVEENFWQYEQVVTGADLSCKGETDFPYDDKHNYICVASISIIYDSQASLGLATFSPSTGRYEQTYPFEVQSEPSSGKLLLNPVIQITVDTEYIILTDFYELPYVRQSEGYFIMTSVRKSPVDGQKHMAIINSDTGEVKDLPLPPNAGGPTTALWSITDKITGEEFDDEFRIVFDGPGVSPYDSWVYVTDITADSAVDYWDFDDYINLNTSIGIDAASGTHDSGDIQRRAFPAISCWPDYGNISYCAPDLIVFAETVEHNANHDTYEAIEGVVVDREGDVVQWLHDMHFDSACSQMNPGNHPSAFMPQVSAYVEGFITGYTPLKGYDNYGLQAVGLCRAAWNGESYEISTGVDGHEYYELNDAETGLDEYQSLKPRVYLSDDGRLVAFEDLEFGVNSVKAMWVDMNVQNNTFDIVEGADDSLIRTFPQGYGSGNQHFAAVSGYTTNDYIKKRVNDYLVVYQEGFYPHNSIYVSAYVQGASIPDGDEFAEPFDLTAGLPFPVSQWKPDCKTSGEGIHVFAGVGFTTQDNEGEAVIVYVKLGYGYPQPVRYTDLVRLTSGEKIKMVRMSGLVEYIPSFEFE